MACIYAVLLLCPLFVGQMRLIALVDQGAQATPILDHIGVGTDQPYLRHAG
jgi:hypothetical protein